MKIKRILALILALGILFCFAACGEPEKNDDTDNETTAAVEEMPEAGEGEKLITVRVVHKDKSVKIFKFRTDAEFLADVLLEHDLIKGSEGQFGLEVSHVDGEQAIYDADKAYWALYEGDQYAMQGVSTTPVVDGATYKYVYTAA